MGQPKAFLQYKRQDVKYRDIEQRINDYKEITMPLDETALRTQAARCNDCGIPFCHGYGCPLGNEIPEFNELITKGRWPQACRLLHSTNNFPEITGRVCPALCEAACTLAVNDDPVLIKHIEYQIVEKGFEQGWIKPQPAKKKTGKRVAVIGSGPAGLTAAQQLARKGHDIVVFEKDERPGGLLRYGIPDFKLEKHIIDRRLQQIAAEGVKFQTGVKVGEDISVRYLHKMFDCVCLAMGAGQPRDLAVTGRGYENIMFAMDYLSIQNKLCSDEPLLDTKPVTAKNKTVVVIGGGDTGSDCVGTARRQGAKEIYQLEILPQPPENRAKDDLWPAWPRKMRTSSSHEEGCERIWSAETKRFLGDEVRVRELQLGKVEWFKKDGQWKTKPVEGSQFTLKANLVILAMGFLHVEDDGIVKDLNLALDRRGNVVADNYATSQPWVFAAGDCTTGASLVVNAINGGRRAAEQIDVWLNK